MNMPVAVAALLAALAACVPVLGFAPADTAADGPVDGEETEPERKERSLMHKILRVAAIVVVGIVIIVVAFMLMESRLIYPSRKEPAAGTWDSPTIEVEHVFFTTSDGVKLSAWFHESPEGPGGLTRPFVITCQGNAGNMSDDAEVFLARLIDRGYGFLAFDYRGYGASEGHPSEKGLYRDVEAAYDYVVKERNVRPCNIVAHGISLGAGVALHLALSRDVQALIMESAFTSIPDVAAEQYVPLRPLCWLIRNRFENETAIRDLKVPLLVIHGRLDEIVPAVMADRLHDAAGTPEDQKTLWIVQKAVHMDALMTEPDAYWTRFERLCSQYATCDE